MNMNKTLLSLFFCFAVFLLADACVSHDLRDIDPPFEVTCTSEHEGLEYLADVEPIIDTKCTIPECHGDNPDIPNWDEHAELASHIDEIQYRITVPLSHPDRMPKAGPNTQLLTDEEREKIYCWLENGAPNN
jgi:hypothetical protein